jgi:hypothetical protein
MIASLIGLNGVLTVLGQKISYHQKSIPAHLPFSNLPALRNSVFRLGLGEHNRKGAVRYF